jgi:6-methylsalicylic acid synthase
VDAALGSAGEDGSFLTDLADAPAPERRERLTADIREQVAAELRLAAEDVELKRPLVEFGVDSVMTVALRVRLQRRYGVDLPPNILWNKPTVAALSGHLADHLWPPDAVDPDSPAAAESS